MAEGKATLKPIFLGSLRDSTSAGLQHAEGTLHKHDPYGTLKNPLRGSYVSRA
jgi:hypothetical protein